MTSTSVLVGLAEIHVLKGPGTFTCDGLGCCIGVCALDPVANIAGCAHIPLPKSDPRKAVDRPGKFVDTSLPELITMMERLGADRERLKFALVGAAKMFGESGESPHPFDLGDRNVSAVEAALSKLGCRDSGRDVGGVGAKILTFEAETGMVQAAPKGSRPSHVANLRKVA